MLCDGASVSGSWRTSDLTKVLTAPADWRGVTSNGLSLLSVNNTVSGSGQVNHLFDAGNNGVIDGVSSEGAVLLSGSFALDVEFGPDGALYACYDTGTQGTMIKRIDSAGTSTTYLTITGTHIIGDDVDGPGIAVGGTASDPIVYLTARDDTGRGAVFALKDGNGDGVIDWANATDQVVEIWRRTDATIGFGLMPWSDAYLEDIEYYKDGAHQGLVFNDYYQGLFALELASDGMSALSGVTINPAVYGADPAVSPAGYKAGFELDLSPTNVIPELSPILLFAPGAFGVLVHLRRRFRT
jgi:hypothetical protein